MPAKDVGETVGEFYLPGGYLMDVPSRSGPCCLLDH
jgi:hypothetical protein